MSPGNKWFIVLLLYCYWMPSYRQMLEDKISKKEHFSRSHTFSDLGGYTDHNNQVHHKNPSIAIQRGTTVQLKTIVESGIWRLVPIPALAPALHTHNCAIAHTCTNARNMRAHTSQLPSLPNSNTGQPLVAHPNQTSPKNAQFNEGCGAVSKPVQHHQG